MQMFLLLFIGLILVNHMNAQTETIINNIPTQDSSYYLIMGDTIYNKVDTRAMFPGKAADFDKFILKNMKIGVGERNGARPGTYIVIVKFIVSQDGHISNIEPETHKGFGMEDEVIRMVNKSPKWIPATLNGRIVSSLYHQKVTFSISEN